MTYGLFVLHEMRAIFQWFEAQDGSTSRLDAIPLPQVALRGPAVSIVQFDQIHQLPIPWTKPARHFHSETTAS